MKLDFKFNAWFVIITLVVALVLVPIIFNFVFMWESGWSRGKTSDWFVLYGNIIGGLIGGFFTYLALILTLNYQNKDKKNEMRPRIDIPHQIIEFLDTGDEINNKQIVIVLNNVGGSLAKNIECSLSLSDFEQAVDALDKVKSHLKGDIIVVPNLMDNGKSSHDMIVRDGEGNQITSLGNIKKNIIQSC